MSRSLLRIAVFAAAAARVAAAEGVAAAAAISGAVPAGAVAAATYQKEDKALRDLYAATGGPKNWQTRCNGCSMYPETKGMAWTGTNNHCEWKGVECAHPDPPFFLNATVERLMLGEMNLSGTIPESIGDFKLLTQLDLGGGTSEHPWNKMSGTVPASIGKLTLVNNLVLEYQAFTGAIPASIGDMSFSGMGNSLRLSGNEFSGPLPASLCKLSGSGPFDGLNYFDVSRNHLSGTVPAACFSGQSEAFFYMFLNNFTGPVPACRGYNCPTKVLLGEGAVTKQSEFIV